MLSNRAKESLRNLATDPNFRLSTQGDSIFATAPGYRSRRVSLRGELQAAGQYLQDDVGVVFPRRGIDATRRTYFRGSSEYAQTQDGREVRLRNAQGELTVRGRQFYTQPEITVEVPTWQLGTGRLGQFRLQTTRVYTESEFPEIGQLFRAADDGTHTEANPGLVAVKDGLLQSIRDNDGLMGQESDMIWRYRVDLSRAPPRR